MRGVGPLVIEERGKSLGVRGRKAAEFLRSYGTKPIYVRGAWVIDGRHAIDLAAWCEYENVRYRWEGAE